jgi:hypothetical protein
MRHHFVKLGERSIAQFILVIDQPIHEDSVEVLLLELLREEWVVFALDVVALLECLHWLLAFFNRFVPTHRPRKASTIDR